MGVRQKLEPEPEKLKPKTLNEKEPWKKNPREVLKKTALSNLEEAKA